MNPATSVIEPTQGILVVDFNATPATYYGGGAWSWAAMLTCPGAPSFPITVTGLYLAGRGGPSGQAAAGSVSGDGKVIAGTDTVSGNYVLNWRFTRE